MVSNVACVRCVLGRWVNFDALRSPDCVGPFCFTPNGRAFCLGGWWLCSGNAPNVIRFSQSLLDWMCVRGAIAQIKIRQLALSFSARFGPRRLARQLSVAVLLCMSARLIGLLKYVTAHRFKCVQNMIHFISDRRRMTMANMCLTMANTSRTRNIHEQSADHQEIMAFLFWFMFWVGSGGNGIFWQ